MNEDTVTIENDGLTLEGTLCQPESSPDSVVLLIADSGNLDRNQNSMKTQLNQFNAIAEHLAEAGIASLRYDKRGCAMSTGNFDITGHSDLVNDANAWTRFLRTHGDTAGKPLYLLGYGEGSLIAPQVIKTEPAVTGQILLCPFLDNYADVIQRQAETTLAEIAVLPGFKGKLIRFFLRISGDQIRKQKKLLARIRKSTKPMLKIRKQVINAKWIREMMSLDAEAIHNSIVTPTLIVAGAKDLQSPPTDASRLEQLLTGPVQTHILPDMTHILKADLEAASTLRYSELSQQPIDPQLLNIITQWLKQER